MALRNKKEYDLERRAMIIANHQPLEYHADSCPYLIYNRHQNCRCNCFSFALRDLYKENGLKEMTCKKKLALTEQYVPRTCADCGLGPCNNPEFKEVPAIKLSFDEIYFKLIQTTSNSSYKSFESALEAIDEMSEADWRRWNMYLFLKSGHPGVGSFHSYYPERKS